MSMTSNQIMFFVLYILSEDVWQKPNILTFYEKHNFNSEVKKIDAQRHSNSFRSIIIAWLIVSYNTYITF